jgi:hypothetical protein
MAELRWLKLKILVFKNSIFEKGENVFCAEPDD